MTWDILRRYAEADLTPSEAAVAQFFESSLPGAAFMNLHQIADAAQVSTATVTRFARKLGFGDFRDLSASLRADARTVLERPGDRLEQVDPGRDLVTERFGRAAGDLESTASMVDREQVHRAVELLADDSRPLVLGAVASGRPLLDHIGLLLAYLRRGVRVLPGTDRWPHEIAGLDEHHVVLATAFDRDPLPVIHLLDRARAVGAATIAITNLAPSPLLRLADIPLRVRTAPGTPFGSRVALLATLEALVDGVAAAASPTRERADAIEATFDALDIHPSPDVPGAR